MHFIDTHVHLYSKQFKDDLETVIRTAQENGVFKMLMPNIDAATIAPMNAIAHTHPTTCFPMIGLHPCHVKEDYETQLETMRAELETGRYIAVGEIGLDLYWEKTFWEQQKEAFAIQTKWAIAKRLPIAVHAREATKEAIEIVQSLAHPHLRGVFHCFVGTLEEAQTLVGMGFYLGIGGVSTFKNGGLDTILPSVSLENIVLETDAPYLAPIPFRGKRNESGYIPHIAKRIAELYQISVEEVAQVTTRNAERLFDLKL